MRIILIVLALSLLGNEYAQTAEEKKVDHKPVQSDTSTKDNNSSPPIPTTINVTGGTQTVDNARHAANGSKQPEQWLDKFWSDPIATFAGLLFFATLGLIGTGIFQWRELQGTVKAMRDEFVSTHRPKIRIKHLWLKEPIESGKQIFVNLFVVNHGGTEARDPQGEIATFIAPSIDYLPAKPTFPGKLFFSVIPKVIPSGMTIEFGDLSDGRILTDDDVSAIKNGGSKLYCFGYVDYRDARGRNRKTAFCRVLQLLPLIPSADGRFREPKEQNPDYEYQD